MFQNFYEFNGSSIFYKMRENFPSMRVSVRMYQIACVSRNLEGLYWKHYFEMATFSVAFSDLSVRRACLLAGF